MTELISALQHLKDFVPRFRFTEQELLEGNILGWIDSIQANAMQVGEERQRERDAEKVDEQKVLALKALDSCDPNDEIRYAELQAEVGTLEEAAAAIRGEK